MTKFKKSEKRLCKYYEWGKCKAQSSGILISYKDCVPKLENGETPDRIEDCILFVKKEIK